MLLSLSNKIYNSPRNFKIFVQLLIDILIVSSSLFFSFFLRLDKDFINYLSIWDQFIPLILITILIFVFFNFYKNILRHISLYFFKQIFFSALLSSFTLILLSLLSEISLPRSIPLIYLLVLLLFLSISRFLIHYIYLLLYKTKTNKIAIFGAGKNGKQLALNLKENLDQELVCFIDDDKKLQGLLILSKPIMSRKKSFKFIKKHNVKKLYISVVNPSKKLKQEIFNQYSDLGITIQIIPSISKLIDKNYPLQNLRNIELEDLLARSPTKPNQILFKKAIKNKTIFISGAGGSIGSEICNQIINYSPKKLIILDSNELALFNVLNKIKNKINRNKYKILCDSILSNLSDLNQLNHIFKKERIDSVFHAAAYKHVSLVENNIIEGFKNNVSYTQNIIKVSMNFNVKNFTLISTDKAVMPTSIMGATKRVTELMCQYYSKKPCNTTFCIVRFGNVLGSSGSVIPKFQDLIDKGGPLYITHPDVTRYFMLISEASELVIQASQLASGGEIFVLDMGKPIKILDLAKLMIKLSGYMPLTQMKNKIISNSFIEIKFTSLKKGEKLHENLFTTKKTFKTSHPLINYESNENVNLKELKEIFSQLNQNIKSKNIKKIIKIIKKNPINYQNLKCQ